MPIYSMTGFARVQVRACMTSSVYTLSLKSVNHRFLDLQLRLPSGLDALEMELRKALKDNLVRGHVELTLSVDRSAQQKAGYNRELVDGYLAAFNAAREEHRADGRAGSERDSAPARRIAERKPRRRRGSGGAGRERAAADGAAAGAVEDHARARRRGAGGDSARIARPAGRGHATAWRSLRPEIEQRYQERLTQRLLAATGRNSIASGCSKKLRCWWTAAIFPRNWRGWRRTSAHFRELLAAGGEVGKKLDFLLQEMNREANTLLSKTGGLGGKGTRITELGLAMKAEIEKAREQIQNVE